MTRAFVRTSCQALSNSLTRRRWVVFEFYAHSLCVCSEERWSHVGFIATVYCLRSFDSFRALTSLDSHH